MLYVMLTFEKKKTEKYYFLNRTKYIDGNFLKSSGKISREQ